MAANNIRTLCESFKTILLLVKEEIGKKHSKMSFEKNEFEN